VARPRNPCRAVVARRLTRFASHANRARPLLHSAVVPW
jgi:hypothetical protein